MDVVVDVCMLITEGPRAITWLAGRVRENDFLLLDKPTGPCWLEIRRHSPSQAGKELRRLEGRDEAYLISKRVHEAFMNLARKASCHRQVVHDGEPKPPLKALLLARVEEQGLHKWWKKDRKWISLAQTVDAADLASMDKGFLKMQDILQNHGIRVYPKIP